jgi:chlorite dismutase
MLLTGIASAFGLGVYLFLVWLFKIRELETFLMLIKKLRRMKAKPNATEMSDEVAGGS